MGRGFIIRKLPQNVTAYLITPVFIDYGKSSRRHEPPVPDRRNPPDGCARALCPEPAPENRPGGSGPFQGVVYLPQEAQELAASAGGSPVGMGEEAGEYLREAQAAAAESRQLELTAQQCGIKLRLLNLKEFFGLSDFEYHAFLVCLLLPLICVTSAFTAFCRMMLPKNRLVWIYFFAVE